jgi:hypothetical protein
MEDTEKGAYRSLHKDNDGDDDDGDDNNNNNTIRSQSQSSSLIYTQKQRIAGIREEIRKQHGATCVVKRVATCVVIQAEISGEGNVIKKGAKRILKCKDIIM